MTISTTSGSGSLEMVSEPDTAQCASKDAGPQRGVDLRRSHIDWRKKRVPAKALGLEGGGLWCPTLIGEENKTPFLRVWKHSLSTTVSGGSGSLHFPTCITYYQSLDYCLFSFNLITLIYLKLFSSYFKIFI